MQYIINTINSLGLLEAVRQVNPAKLTEILSSEGRQPTPKMEVFATEDEMTEDGSNSVGNRITGPFSDGYFLSAGFHYSRYTNNIAVNYYWVDYNPTPCRHVGGCATYHEPECNGWGCDCDINCECDSCLYGEDYCTTHEENH